MTDDSVVRFRTPESPEDPSAELLRKGARQLLRQAIEAEVAQLLAEYADQQDALGRTAVVRNSYLPERKVLTGVGPISVKVP